MTSHIRFLIVVTVLDVFSHNDAVAEHYQDQMNDHHCKDPNEATDDQSCDCAADGSDKTITQPALNDAFNESAEGYESRYRRNRVNADQSTGHHRQETAQQKCEDERWPVCDMKRADYHHGDTKQHDQSDYSWQVRQAEVFILVCGPGLVLNGTTPEMFKELPVEPAISASYPGAFRRRIASACRLLPCFT